MADEITIATTNEDVEKQTQASSHAEQTSRLTSSPVIDDPFKWTLRKKILVASIIFMGVLSLTFSSSAYASSIAQIRDEFQISQEVALLGIALFVLGFSLSPIVFGPLVFSIGHRWTYILSYGCFTAFAFGAAEARNGASLVILRFWSGFFGGSTFNNALATVADFTYPQQINRFSVFFALAAFGGPGLGPVVCSFISQRAGWRWSLRVQAIFAASIFLAFIFFVPETNKAIIERRALKLKVHKKREAKIFMERAINIWKQLGDPVVAVICFYLAVLYGILYGFFGVIPYVFGALRGFTPEQVGLCYISLVVGFCLSGLVIFFPQQWYYNKLAREDGPASISAEARVHQGIWGAWFIPIGLFIFAWTAPFIKVPFIAPLIGVSTFSLGTGIIFTSFIPYLALYGGVDAALVLASSTLTRGAVAASFPLFVTQMNKAMHVQGANSFLAGLSLLLAPLPLIFTWKGEALRKQAAARRLTSSS